MNRAWRAEEAARAALAASEPGMLAGWMGALGLGGSAPPAALTPAEEASRRLEHTLVQADAYMHGALMQLLLGSYVKGAWNLRTAWRMYQSAFSELEAGAGTIRADLACLIDFGVGMFNLVVSLLPGRYLKLGAEFAGFSGDRELALRLLRRSHDARQFWSPFSGLLLLYYVTQLAPNVGLDYTVALEEARALLASDTIGKLLVSGSNNNKNKKKEARGKRKPHAAGNP